MSVEIKGITVPALLIKLDETKSIEENIKEIEKKLSSTFFKGSVCVLDTSSIKLSQEEKKQIEEVLKKYNSKILGYKHLQTTEEKQTLEEKKEEKLPEIKEKTSLKIIPKTVRSGQRIEHDGDILILGDVNPDAYIIASGNIIVMGTLRGFAHAGANGDETAIVLALKLIPRQLRIANYLTRSPDEIEEPEYPEKAYVENNQIIIERI